MPRRASGQVIERQVKDGRVFALRFRAYGKRRYLTLGTVAEGWSRTRAAEELANVLADVRRGIWRPDVRKEAPEPVKEPSFHEFASEWLAGLRSEGLSENTLKDYAWQLSNHLLAVARDLRPSRRSASPEAGSEDWGAASRSLYPTGAPWR